MVSLTYYAASFAYFGLSNLEQRTRLQSARHLQEKHQESKVEALEEWIPEESRQKLDDSSWWTPCCLSHWTKTTINDYYIITITITLQSGRKKRSSTCCKPPKKRLHTRAGLSSTKKDFLPLGRSQSGHWTSWCFLLECGKEFFLDLFRSKWKTWELLHDAKMDNSRL